MTESHLEQLEEAIRSLSDPLSSRSDLYGIDLVLDGIVSCLRPFYELPKQVREFAIPLDEALAYLAKQDVVSPAAVHAANKLIECAGRVSYDPDKDGTLDEANDYRSQLYEELDQLLETLRQEESGDD